jgi:hypothetical protein
MPGAKQACPTVAACWSPATPRMAASERRTCRVGRAEIGGAVAHLRQQARAAHRTAAAQVLVPAPGVNVVEQRCARRWWRRSRARRRRSGARAGNCRPCRRPVRRARRARARRAHGRESRRSWCGKIGVEQAGARATIGSWPSAFSARRCPPCGDPARRWRCGSAGRCPLPDQRRLALVGDADGGDIARRRARPCASAPRMAASVVAQMSSGSCSTQPERGIMLRELLLRDARHRCRSGRRTGWRARMSCPDRWRGDSAS